MIDFGNEFKVAAVQAASVYLNLEGTLDKLEDLTREAVRNGAKAVLFPEVFVPGYPLWIWLDSPLRHESLFQRLLDNSVSLTGEATQRLSAIARRNECVLIVGVNELGEHSSTELYNTTLVFTPDGSLVQRHRKLMPTMAEKLVWGFGDGSTLYVNDGPIGKFGVLNCGENGNSLLRYALIAQAEQVHFANYAPGLSQGEGMYDLRKGVETRSLAHSFEGKLFTIVASGLVGDDMKEILGTTPERRDMLEHISGAYTAVVGPGGTVIGGPSDPFAEEIIYADINLRDITKYKMFHDISGNYNRFDVVSLNLNRRPWQPIMPGGMPRLGVPRIGSLDVSELETDVTSSGIESQDFRHLEGGRDW